jgi:hypothetical protein
MFEATLSVAKPQDHQLYDLHAAVGRLIGSTTTRFAIDPRNQSPNTTRLLIRKDTPFTGSISQEKINITPDDKVFHLSVCPRVNSMNTKTGKQYKKSIYKDADRFNAWLAFQTNKRGFSIKWFDTLNTKKHEFHTINGRYIACYAITIAGVMTVHDPDLYMDTHVNGFGDDRAYGFGLPVILS